MQKNERTLQMMQNYVRLHADGLSPIEIAKVYDLSAWTVYNALQEIADKAGVSRESLLARPHSEHQPFERISEPVKPIKIEAFRERFQNALDIMSEFREMVDLAIETAEEYERVNEGRVCDGDCDDASEECATGNQKRDDA